jgi:hypothetical protein
MPHRHYGVPIAKRRPTYSGPTRAAAWSGGTIVGGIIATVIVLGFVVCELSKIVAHATVVIPLRRRRARPPKEVEHCRRTRTAHP